MHKKDLYHKIYDEMFDLSETKKYKDVKIWAIVNEHGQYYDFHFGERNLLPYINEELGFYLFDFYFVNGEEHESNES